MIRRSLFALLGPARYLRVVSRSFFLLFRAGWLRSQPAYFDHYLVETLVQEGDRVIDIGANLGYYTVLFSDRVGTSGKVFAVEPVGLFRDVLVKNLARRSNVEVIACALGEEDGAEIEMGVPAGHATFRHGLTRVLHAGERDDHVMVFKATMRHPMTLFGDLDRLDYVKCDVEGHEVHVLPLLAPLFERLHPIVQVETGGEQRQKMLAWFAAMGYHVFGAGRRRLHPLTDDGARHHAGDLLFVHPARASRLENRVSVRASLPRKFNE